MTAIGIIGAGRIGSGIARLASDAGLDVAIANSRGPESLASIAEELGPHVRATSVEGTARSSDIVIVAIPLGAYRTLTPEAFAGRVVVDAMNYYPERDGELAEFEGSPPSSRVVQNRLSRAHVVKAFNNIDYLRLVLRSRDSGAPDRSALPVAGDDPAAVSAVGRLLDRLGYDAVVEGDLDGSWRSEPGTPVYVQPYLGYPPTGLGASEHAVWFENSPGRAVPENTVRRLLDAAVRDGARESVFRPGFLGADDESR